MPPDVWAWGVWAGPGGSHDSAAPGPTFRRSPANAYETGRPRLAKRLGGRQGRLQNRCSRSWSWKDTVWSVTGSHCWG